MARNLVVMRYGKRMIRFDIGKVDAIITGAVGRATKQAISSIEVARDFCGELMNLCWERDQRAEEALKSAKLTEQPAVEA